MHLELTHSEIVRVTLNVAVAHRVVRMANPGCHKVVSEPRFQVSLGFESAFDSSQPKFVEKNQNH